VLTCAKLYGGLDYALLDRVIGNFDEMKTEFRRQLGNDYEDRKKLLNGDVYQELRPKEK